MSICENLGINIINYQCPKELSSNIKENRYKLIIDGIFGIGINRDLSPRYEELIDYINQVDVTKIAIDIPSGICADTGRILGSGIKADLTISVQCEKRGTVLFPGKAYAGKVVIIDVGIETSYRDNQEGRPYSLFDERNLCYTFEADDVQRLLPKRWDYSHKGTYGKVLIIAGSKGMAGAAYLSARAAYGVGVGLVHIYTPNTNCGVLQTLLPEAIISSYDDFEPTKLDNLLNWTDVVCMGPGLGQSAIAKKIVEYTLENINVPVVIDADGINLSKEHKSLMQTMRTPCIITPHLKEMANLMDLSVSKIQENPIKTLENFTDQFPIICVLKDARTLIGQKNSPFFINTSGNHSMAKAGSGDVLAGIITGLIAHKESFTPYMAATFATYLHGLGGDSARDLLGSNSVLARDIITGVENILHNYENI
jgi:NAD(P)H-hydrate epimerase